MNEFLTFWSPDGWVSEPGNMPDHLGMTAEDTDQSSTLERLGWEEIEGPDDPVSYGLHVHRNDATSELLVEIWGVTHRLTSFFVAARHADIFMATEFLRMRVALAQIRGEHLRGGMVKAQIAFIRHGHGEGTIDEDGEMNLEDRRRARRRMESERLRQAGGKIQLDGSYA